jgi:hypothetical protein
MQLAVINVIKKMLWNTEIERGLPEEGAQYRKGLKHGTRNSSRKEATKIKKDPKTRICEVYLNRQQQVTLKHGQLQSGTKSNSEKQIYNF